MEFRRNERGWAGHFICANRCRFRRNTLLEYNGTEIVVSTVGLMENPPELVRDKPELFPKFEELGYNRYYETMAFYANPKDTRYHDIDVSKQINFDSEWAIAELDANDKANDMHEMVVKELSTKLIDGTLSPSK